MREILNLQAQLLASGPVVPIGTATWLLAVSRTRVETLLSSARLRSQLIGGGRFVELDSILEYAKERALHVATLATGRLAEAG